MIEKTEGFLGTIGQALSDKRSNDGGGSTIKEERGESKDSKDGKVTSTSKYYEQAHAKTEDVGQASILVGGSLKDYQLKGENEQEQSNGGSLNLLLTIFSCFVNAHRRRRVDGVAI